MLLPLLVASFGAALSAASSSRKPAAVLTAGGALAGALLFVGLRFAAPLISVKDVGTAVHDEARPEDAVWTYGPYPHGLAFYAGRPVDKILRFTGEFHYAKRDHAYDARFGDDPDVAALPRAGGRTFLVLREGEVQHFTEVLPPAATGSWRAFGPWRLVVVRAR
jgi:hypothetical protein